MEWLTDEQIGLIIKTRRIELKLTQTELGKKIGVGAAAVQKWEAGTVTNIKRNVLKRISEVLGINPAVLVGYDVSNYIIISKSEIDQAQCEQIQNFIKFIKDSGDN